MDRRDKRKLRKITKQLGLDSFEDIGLSCEGVYFANRQFLPLYDDNDRYYLQDKVLIQGGTDSGIAYVYVLNRPRTIKENKQFIVNSLVHMKTINYKLRNIAILKVSGFLSYEELKHRRVETTTDLIPC